MSTYGYEAALARRVSGSGPVSLAGGSGYFASRGQTLDPSLFDGDTMRPDVRQYILRTFHKFLGRTMISPQLWTTLWAAGSGVTTAWDADREAGGAPGDLDVLVGVDYDALRSLNAAYQGSSDESIAHEINQHLHDHLWPHTDHTRINGGVYELTYYVNAGVGSGMDDILAINPYAALNIDDGHWSQIPVDVPHDFSDLYFSAADRAQTAKDADRAKDITWRFNALRESSNALPDNSPYKVNMLRSLHDVVGEGAALFDDIHDHRHDAFAPGGKGYFDPANYRWQAGKASGAVNASRMLKQIDEQAHQDAGLGGDHINTSHLLLLGALANGGRR